MVRTYDEYSSELTSGHLSWTPVHESDDFWKENATRLNDRDYEQLKWVSSPPSSSSPLLIIWFGVRTLIKLLNDSQDPVVLAVAVHDLGQYIKHYKQGKKCVLFSSPLPHFPPVLSLSFRVITDLGAKTRAMELMGHEDPDVRYRALLSVQQLVSQPWVTT